MGTGQSIQDSHVVKPLALTYFRNEELTVLSGIEAVVEVELAVDVFS